MDHVDRMGAEYGELLGRMARLSEFLDSVELELLPAEDRSDLVEQLRHMVSYGTVLCRRLERARRSRASAG